MLWCRFAAVGCVFLSYCHHTSSGYGDTWKPAAGHSTEGAVWLINGSKIVIISGTLLLGRESNVSNLPIQRCSQGNEINSGTKPCGAIQLSAASTLSIRYCVMFRFYCRSPAPRALAPLAGQALLRA